MKIAHVEVRGHKYKLQHPGAQRYFKRAKSLRYVTTDGYIQMAQDECFNFCFGHPKSHDERVVFTEDGARVRWEDADFESSSPEVPTLIELEEVWAVILPNFLRGELRDSEPEDGEECKWKWISEPKNDNNNGNVFKEISSTSKKTES